MSARHKLRRAVKSLLLQRTGKINPLVGLNIVTAGGNTVTAGGNTVIIS